MAQQPVSFSNVLKTISLFLRDRFNLDEDKASEKATIEDISKDVVFRGPNLWILIFAIMVASIGLNMNSTAVVIGAMLISPLMGPIMGVGLGIGINDFELIVKALRNLGIAVVISVLTSALYFIISPLDDAQSELLSRTTPTLWDVLIALFGGLAGIVAGSRREKSNAIPGVAIATALMPPLCTAGFGLATAQWNYFFGAAYLFFINSVFISFSTYLIVKVLGFRPKEFVDASRERRVKGFIYFFVIITCIPSVYTAYNVVLKSIFEKNASLFVNNEMQFDNCRVISRQYLFDRNQKRIEVTLFGEHIDSSTIQILQEKMPEYRLQEADLVILQAFNGEQNQVELPSIEQLNTQMRTGIIEELYKKNDELLRKKEDQIKILEEEIIRLRSREIPIDAIAQEVKVINKNIKALSVAPTIVSNLQDSLTFDTVFLAYTDFIKKPTSKEQLQIEDWLKARIQKENVRLIVD